nr:hypothetical protein [Tanacetum cinerariifolium]GEZ37926.1 hypothetical protein [Tanacetum cinerariifolium]
MRERGCAIWDGGKITWGGRARVFGTVPMYVRVQEMAGGEGRVLAGMVVKGALFRIRQSCSSVRDYQAQAEGQKVRKEEEIKALWFKEVKEDADEDVTLVDVDTAVEIDADIQGRIEEDVIAIKEINFPEPEPTVFNDDEVTMTMAQTLIKMKAKKARIIDEQMAKRLQVEEIEQAAAREKQEKEELERAKVLQQLYDQKKIVSVAQAKKNMIVYLKNMTGFKIAHFKGMTYDQVKPIFEKEYKKVQIFFKPDRDEEPAKKRVAEETLL